MFRQLPNKSSKVDNPDKIVCPSIIEDNQNIENAPYICLIDFTSEEGARLNKIGFNTFIGSLGTPVEIPNKSRRDSHSCLLNFLTPENLHEYDVVIINMCEQTSIPYNAKEHTREFASAREQIYFICEFPETIFDPRQYASMLIKKNIDKVLENGGTLIVFAGSNRSFEYHIGELKRDNYFQIVDKKEVYAYSFSTDFPNIESKIGREVSVLKDIKEFNELLSKYLQNVKYKAVFKPQLWWTEDLANNGCHFIPLMVNSQEEIVSFYRTHKEQGHVIVFPQINDKLSFLEDLLTNTLPSLIPNAFPQSTTFSWVKKDAYLLPNEAELKTKMENAKIEYENIFRHIQEEIDKNSNHYEWLHKLVTGTDNELVVVVKKYLEWLGFEKVVNMDEINTNLKEEDLQIEVESNLLVIEIKGIGGTSKDSECSQIGKIVGRRMREQETTKVHGLYIVNHQRFQEPLIRSNPPFTTKQIGDAEYESRGLLTTYQLFNLYFSIENGVISKEYAREQFQKSGLIEFIPKDCSSLGKPHEIYRNGEIIILNIDMHVKQNDELIIHRNGKYLKTQILEIEDNDRAVTEAFSGEIGFKVDKIVKKTDELFFMNKDR